MSQNLDATVQSDDSLPLPRTGDPSRPRTGLRTCTRDAEIEVCPHTHVCAGGWPTQLQKVDDRVLFSSQIGSDGDPTTTNPVEQILQDNNVVAVQVFINAGDTKTTGTDIVLNYNNIQVGENGKLNASFAANFNETTIDAINTPPTIAAAGYNIFDRQEQGLITNSRPKSKMILGLNYINDKWDFSLNNTRFGEVTVTAPESGGTDQDLSAKISTDLGFGYKLTDKISFNANINNIFDVYPDVTLASTNTAQAGSRFKYSSEVQQMGQLGTNFSVGINYQF